MGAEGWGHGREGVGYKLYLVKADRSGKMKKLKLRFTSILQDSLFFLKFLFALLNFQQSKVKFWNASLIWNRSNAFSLGKHKM